MSWNYSCSLCFPLCFTSEMKHALPTSGSKSTFIFDSLSFSVLGSATWSLPLGTAASRNWIPFIDMLGMANLMGEITATPEVWASVFPSLVSRGRITAYFYPKNWSSAYEPTAEIFAVVCKPWRWPQAAFFFSFCFLLFLSWMLVLFGQCTRQPVKGQRYDSLLFFIMLHMCLQGVKCIPY